MRGGKKKREEKTYATGQTERGKREYEGERQARIEKGKAMVSYR